MSNDRYKAKRGRARTATVDTLEPAADGVRPSLQVARAPGDSAPAAVSGPGRGLQLRRPLVALDVETTGLSISHDRIVELSCLKLYPNGKRQVLTYRLNPQRPISPEATAVHGISSEDLAAAPVFADVAAELVRFLRGADLTGFNLLAFDLPLLVREMERVGRRFPSPGTRIIDTRRIYLAKEPRSLAAAYQLYCGKPLQHAHTAAGDALAAAEILLAQIARYSDLPLDVEGLHGFCHPDPDRWVDPDRRLYWRESELALAVGKYRHRLVREIWLEDAAYLEWLLNDGIPPAVIELVRAAHPGGCTPSLASPGAATA